MASGRVPNTSITRFILHMFILVVRFWAHFVTTCHMLDARQPHEKIPANLQLKNHILTFWGIENPAMFIEFP